MIKLGRTEVNIKFVTLALVLAVVMGVVMIQGEKQLDTLSVVTNAVAKTGCSCVFIAERPLEACLADNPPGFDLASAYVDREAKTVRTSIYGVVRGAASFRGPLGCTLD